MKVCPKGLISGVLQNYIKLYRKIIASISNLLTCEFCTDVHLTIALDSSVCLDTYGSMSIVVYDVKLE